MADVRITYSRDKAAAAARLGEAISAKGYDVRSYEIADLGDLFEAENGYGNGAATILIWSRALLSSALGSGLLRQVRQEKNLIEVSADGVGPQAPEGDTRVVMISGWRGQPFHPGWQRIASDLERICGQGRNLAEPARPVEPAAPPRADPSPTPSAAKESDRRPLMRIALGAMAAAGLFGAGFATSSWIGNRPMGFQAFGPSSSANAKPETSAVPIGPGTGPAVAPANQPAAPKPNPALAAQPRAAEAPIVADSPTQASAPPPERPRSAERKSAESRAAKADSKPTETARYSRKNSQVMRLFCEGAGRTTPQCKTFLRATRSTRGSRR